MQSMHEDFLSKLIAMRSAKLEIDYEVYSAAEELNAADRELLQKAREVTSKAYAPYSHFQVGAIAHMDDGSIAEGTNQENASYPVGVCAERVLLGNVAMLHPGQPIKTLAIAYHNLDGDSSKPVSPCGMCRQAISEYETRTGKSIRLILSGMEGAIFIIKRAGDLLPMSFGSKDLLGE
jgi:cytidine deaminase